MNASTFSEALRGVVETANTAMAEVRSHDDSAQDRIRAIWFPISEALLASEPDFKDWPELEQQANECWQDYVGVTSDTRQVVRWGERMDNGARRFVILDRPSAA